MTLPQARSRLGLAEAGPLDKGALKRAYLLAIKRHKPEVDPQGFQEVRQAYELLEQLVGVENVGQAEGTPIAVAAPAQSHEAEGPRPAQGPDHLEPYREKLRQLGNAPWPVRAEVGRDAFCAFPGDTTARHFFLELVPAESTAQVIGVLLEGAEAGDETCLWRLLEHAPKSVPESQLERLEEGSLYGRYRAARTWIEKKQPDRALSVLERMLPRPPGQVPEPVAIELALELILALQAHFDARHEKRARSLLHAYLGAPGLSLELASPRTTALFVLCTDLGTADYLPAELRREIAAGALKGDWSGLSGSLAAADRTYGNSTMDRKLHRLQLEAPTLHRVVASHRLVFKEKVEWGGLRRLALTVLVLMGTAMARSLCESAARPAVLSSPSEVRR
jgi:hypothetical protein